MTDSVRDETFSSTPLSNLADETLSRLYVKFMTECSALSVDQLVETAAHTHHVRTTGRRLEAALKLYRRILRKKQSKELRRELKRLRRRAGQARRFDRLLTDVTPHLEKLSATTDTSFAPMLESWRHEREKYRSRLHNLASAFCQAHPQMPNWCRQSAADNATTILEIAKETILEKADEFQGRIEQNKSQTLGALHRERLAGKKLRYAIELFAPVMGPKTAKKILRSLRSALDDLGVINDCRELRSALRDWTERSDDYPQEAYETLEASVETKLRELREAYAKKRTTLFDQDFFGAFASWINSVTEAAETSSADASV